MRNRLFYHLWLLFALAFMAAQQSRADCPIQFSSPRGNTLTAFITSYPDYPNSTANFRFIIQDTNQPLPMGTYWGWCVDANTPINPDQDYTVPGTVFTGSLYPDCDTNLNSELPPGHPNSYVSPDVWQQVNYMLNHKNGAYFWEVQVAINTLVGGPPPTDPGYPPFSPVVVQALLNDAASNAPAWVPQCGDVIGVIDVITNEAGVTLTSPVQLLMIEVPTCSVTFTTVPTNIDLGCNPPPSSIPTCRGTVDTNVVNAVSCCGHPVTITCDESDSSVDCKNIRILIYTATDGYGNTATTSQTITWTVDTTVPVITSVPTGGALGCNPALLPSDAIIQSKVTATDTCSAPTICVTHVDSGSPCSMSRTFTITAKDNCGNVSNPQTVVYTWTIDTNAPVITTVPQGADLGCNPANLPSDDSIQAQVTASGTCSTPTICVSHVDSGTPCSMSRTFTITAKDACGLVSTPATVVYTYKINTNAPVLVCPPDYFISNGVTSVSCYNQDGWRGACNSNCWGTLNNCFSKIYQNGYIQCGTAGWSGHSLTCTGPQYIKYCLPCSGTPGCLNNDYVNPSSCSGGSFAGNVLCLQLNVDFCDHSNITGFTGCLGNLVLNDPTCPLNGKSVRQILDCCQTALGGGSTGNCNIRQLDTLCSNLINSFSNCVPSDWCKSHLGGVVTTNVPPSQSGYATATDSCGDTPVITYSDVVIPAGCNGSYTIERTWKATDSCGNVSTCTQNISIGNSKSSVCGYVFLDCNGDGLLSPGLDSGLSNIVVLLKNANGVAVATNTTDGTGAYCFYNLNPGTYTVTVPSLTNYVQTAGCHTTHWVDNSGNDCWYENDGYQHCKNGSGYECWTAYDGCQHYKNSYGQDCWKDRYGTTHTQNCSYVSCNVPKNNSETFTLAGCQALTSVNFAYKGAAPQCAVTVTGPSKGVCGKTYTYTCTVTNTGTACFTGCTVTACGNNYTCPPLQAGQGCSFQFNYCYKYSDCGNFKCDAVASCKDRSGNSCTGKSSCSTSVGYW